MTQCICNSINIRKINFIAYIYIHFNPEFDEKSGMQAKIETWKHFIAYIYIHFNPEFDEKSGMQAKIETWKHLHAVVLLTAEQHHWCHDGAEVQSDCRRPWFILMSKSCDVVWLDLIIEMKTTLRFTGLLKGISVIAIRM